MFKKLLSVFTLIVSTLFFSVPSMADVDYRLPSNIQPTFQKINLKVDPDKPDYSGSTMIDITVSGSADKIGFYQIDLVIDKAELISGDTRLPMTVSAGDYHMNWASTGDTITAGKYKLALTFHGKVNTSSDGMYLSTFEDRNYIFTQFEDMHARRAFPSFDEPSFKIPYQLTISSPEKNTVLSNTLVAKRSVADGWQTVTFNKTKPMPTYIVAYAIGEFDSAPIEGLSIPGHIYTPKGKADKTKFIATHTAEILKALESYFGAAYPFEKVDFIAVPNFTHGAMENAGLITYRDSYLLLGDNPRLTERTGPLNVVAHELAHMWYGNLVTMAWWDDLWLNEAFASWMSGKVMVKLYPELNTVNNLVQEGAFPEDALPTTRPIKKVVREAADVMDGLGLNYSKGESILLMVENLIGEENFQKGIQQYIKDRSWKNAEASDLWRALGAVSDIDLPAMMKTYIEQPGYALINFGENGQVTQERYLLSDEGNKKQVWQVPLSVKYKLNGKVEHMAVTLTQPSQMISKLSEAEWVYPDAGALGYFRWNIPAAQLDALLNDTDKLSSREKKSFINNIGALFTAGKVSLQEQFKALAVLANDSDPMVVRTVFSRIGQLDYLVDDSNRELYARFVEKMALPWFKELGTVEKEGESDDLIKLRYSVFSLLSRTSHNKQVLATARQLSESYLKDANSVPASLAGNAMAMVARHSGQQWFTTLEDAFKATTDARVKGTIGRGFYFEQPELITKALDLNLTDYVTPANVIYGLYYASGRMDDKTLMYQWLVKNFEALTQKMPAYHIAHMPQYVSSSCSVGNITLAKDFYKERMEKFEGMARSFEVMLQSSHQCVELKGKYQADFTEFLKAQ
ncbi:M1 family metallopeptidase [Neptunicella marina]|uniref:Aminopeptidase n=1 Tax=Neptunicella marina TaxID=2125989 RepID=A0A8J6ISN3_9ALTE|nr:M1 family metallopeptidase [Neptunicella marina]MBC3764868.1 M1 family metallopeptidase [Neptunicella marina]